jgi:glycosyltransferase involved in cell wall biosynthesis
MASDSIDVCHVVNAVDTTSVPADIAIALSRYTDVRADVLAWFSAEEFEDDDHIDIHDLDAPDTMLGIDRSTLRRARNLLSTYDVIQTHHPHSGTFAKPIGAMQGATIISTEQNTHGGFNTKGLVGNAVTNPLADVVTCVSESVRESFTWWERRLLAETEVRVIYNGVDLKRVVESRDTEWYISDTADIDPGSFLVGTAGMLIEQKAHDVLVRGAAMARDRGYDIELVIAGDGDLRESLEELANDLGVAGSVHVLGLIDRTEVYSLMTQLDLYAMPSRWEGFSAAAIEALGLGVPCLFSNISEFTKPFANVAAFHQVDDPADLSDRLCELVDDDQWRTRLGEKGARRAEDFTLETIAAQYADLYEELTGSAPRTYRYE